MLSPLKTVRYKYWTKNDWKSSQCLKKPWNKRQLGELKVWLYGSKTKSRLLHTNVEYSSYSNCGGKRPQENYTCYSRSTLFLSSLWCDLYWATDNVHTHVYRHISQHYKAIWRAFGHGVEMDDRRFWSFFSWTWITREKANKHFSMCVYMMVVFTSAEKAQTFVLKRNSKLCLRRYASPPITARRNPSRRGPA